MNETSNLIKTLRESKGLSQNELASKINVSDKTISKWETGRGLPDTSSLIKLADLFSITVDELLRGKVNNNQNNQSILKNSVQLGYQHVKLLVEQGMDITQKDQFNKNIYDYVLETEDYQIIEYLIDQRFITFDKGNLILKNQLDKNPLLYHHLIKSIYKRFENQDYSKLKPQIQHLFSPTIFSEKRLDKSAIDLIANKVSDILQAIIKCKPSSKSEPLRQQIVI